MTGVQTCALPIHGVGLGGDHVDQALFRALLFPLLGKGEMWRRKGEDRQIETLFPFELYEDLILNWAVSYLLNQNQYTTPVQQCLEMGVKASALCVTRQGAADSIPSLDEVLNAAS